MMLCNDSRLSRRKFNQKHSNYIWRRRRTTTTTTTIDFRSEYNYNKMM
jgi:hypothetical protein